MIWQFLMRFVPVSWILPSNPPSRRSRLAFWIASRAWWSADHQIGLERYPHFQRGVDRVLDGRSIRWP